WKITRPRETESYASTDQPEPWIDVALAVKWFLKASKEPNESLIASATSPSGSPPPSGERLFQKIVWLMCPPRLNARFFSYRFTAARSPASRAAASLSRAAFAPSTYVL